ncbi:LysE/ArgO family amino acid transporter [Albimonas pacifica]|uniref:L-lysine exporter family protein LysE/ArgO n=1 Tax=Albimonas pacifica TaxID=1114924 RepID=A0A1I3HVF3_9RHOB|nr:LysE/ArgO family amino acid transporter [Albimonas pacifica]SFI39579.1 L-lysine exporter family protein LysE/ArgO [Albimonas pacifica]
MTAAGAWAAGATGFATGFSLILAIGAQNAFVLRQGLRGRHVFWVCLTCAVSDAALIAAGVAGFGAAAGRWPWLGPAMALAGAAFLAVYGALRLRAAMGPAETLATGGGADLGLRAALLQTLAFTWLNPHVYLDTLALVGAVGAPFQGVEKLGYGIGAAGASFVFFFGLGYGARLLAPVFARPAAWRALDAGIAVVMWAIAASLVLHALG